MKRLLAAMHRRFGPVNFAAHPLGLGRWWVLVPWVLAAVLGAQAVHAQSLLEQPVNPAPQSAQGKQRSQPQQADPNAPPGTDAAIPPSSDAATTAATAAAAEHARANPAAAQLEGFSLFLVVPPKPTKWSKHDLIEIIINESSLQKLEQTDDLQKNYSNKATLTNFPSLKDLFEKATLREGIGSSQPAVGVTNDNTYKGQAKINRTDQITAKITAEVIDVKPNGSLVLEAKESIQTDREITTMVLSGTCRAADISKSNTVQSSQLAGLNIRIEHEGETKDTASKGWITRVMEAIFNF